MNVSAAAVVVVVVVTVLQHAAIPAAVFLSQTVPAQSAFALVLSYLPVVPQKSAGAVEHLALSVHTTPPLSEEAAEQMAPPKPLGTVHGLLPEQVVILESGSEMSIVVFELIMMTEPAAEEMPRSLP